MREGEYAKREIVTTSVPLVYGNREIFKTKEFFMIPNFDPITHNVQSSAATSRPQNVYRWEECGAIDNAVLTLGLTKFDS